MAGSRGYNSYRGRTSLGKILLIVFLVLVILAAVGFLLLQKYIVYDDSGSPRFEFPTEDSTPVGSSDTSDPGPDVSLTIEEPALPNLTGMLFPALSDWTQVQADSQCNAVCLTLKDTGGIYYTSAAAAAVSTQLVHVDAAQSLDALTGDDRYYTIARLSCLRDSIAARANVDSMGLKNTGGYLFYDGNNENWLDPSKDATQTYLGALAVECAAQGFDEILLTDLAFPSVGKLNKIAYPTTGMESSLAACLHAVRSALDTAGYQAVKLSLELDAQTLTAGSNALTGQVVSDLCPDADRIYVAADASAVPALEAALKSAGEAELIPEVTAPGALTQYLLVKTN